VKALLLSTLFLLCSSCATSGPRYTQLEQLLPTTLPAGFSATDSPVLRDRNSIFEQINGGSVSYLDNGMVDALFTTLAQGDDNEPVLMDVEIYRFEQAVGAEAQFAILHGGEGSTWHQSKAVVHEYGVEFVVDQLVVRIAYNEDTPDTPMARGAAQLGQHILGVVTED
jgi:hypothetical protein